MELRTRRKIRYRSRLHNSATERQLCDRRARKLEPGISNAQVIALTKAVLNGLYKKGLLTGHEENGIMYYNLQKITRANDGTTNPDLLTPGLD